MRLTEPDESMRSGWRKSLLALGGLLSLLPAVANAQAVDVSFEIDWTLVPGQTADVDCEYKASFNPPAGMPDIYFDPNLELWVHRCGVNLPLDQTSSVAVPEIPWRLRATFETGVKSAWKAPSEAGGIGSVRLFLSRNVASVSGRVKVISPPESLPVPEVRMALYHPVYAGAGQITEFNLGETFTTDEEGRYPVRAFNLRWIDQQTGQPCQPGLAGCLPGMVTVLFWARGPGDTRPFDTQVPGSYRYGSFQSEMEARSPYDAISGQHTEDHNLYLPKLFDASQDPAESDGQPPPNKPIPPQASADQAITGGPPSCQGLPVHLVTGSVFFSQKDAVLNGIGRSLALTRTYRSRRAYHGLSGAFGRGWEHSYEKVLTVVLPDLVLRIEQGDGAPVYFSDKDRDQTYRAYQPGFEQSWVVKHAGGYTRYFLEGDREEYDTSGRLVSQTDRVGNVTSFGRDAGAHLTSITLPGGRALAFEYQGDRATRLSGPQGTIATYAYGGDLLQSVAYPDGGGYSFTYDSNGQVLTVVDASGRTLETHSYDGARALTSEIADGREKFTFTFEGEVTRVTDTLGRTTTYQLSPTEAGFQRVSNVSGGCSCGTRSESESWTFGTRGRVSSRFDANSQQTGFSYDERGVLTQVEGPLGRTVNFTRDSFGRVLTATDPAGAVTTLTHAAAGALSATNALGNTVRFEYAPNGLLTSSIDGRDKATTMAHNGFGDVTSVTDALGHVTSLSYDTAGRVSRVQDPLENETAFAYDSRGRLVQVTNPDGTQANYVYDLGGRLISVTDGAGRTTRYAYDPYGRLSTVEDPAHQTTHYEYDLMSRLVKLTDASGRATRFEHDDFDRVTATVFPDGRSESYAYDPAGRLIRKADRKGVVTSLQYDAGGRLLSKSYSDGTPRVSYSYRLDDRVASVSDGVELLSFSYDAAGRLKGEQSSRGGTSVAWDYDANGNRISLSLNGALLSSYGYDDVSRLSSLARGSASFGFSYDAAGRRTGMALPNSVATTYGYDVMSRLTSLRSALEATPVVGLSYAYDASGNRTSKTASGLAEAYAYDAESRLVEVDRTGATPKKWLYGYDAAGNRVSEQVDQSVSRASYADTNQILTKEVGGPLRVRGTLNEPASVKVNGVDSRILAGNVFEAVINTVPGTNAFTVEATDRSGNVAIQDFEIAVAGTPASFTHDANGNLIGRMEGTTTWSYQWNGANQLERVLKAEGGAPAAEVARFVYDPLGRRVEKVAGATTTTWAYDGADILRETINDGSTTTTYRYIHGPGIDEPLARENASTGAMQYYHADGLGSIVKMTDGTGVVTQTRQYDAWGNLELGADQPGYAFTGREWDPEIGLYYYRARYYDQKIGRFISEDPIGFGGGKNFYAYVEDNPTGNIDPLGLSTLQVPPGTSFLDRLFLPFTITPAPLAAQMHHIATNKAIKSGITAAFEKIFEKAGVSLKDPVNKVLLEGHTGPHSPLYHQYVLDRLRAATAGLHGEEYAKALRAALDEIARELLENPDLIRGCGLK